MPTVVIKLELEDKITKNYYRYKEIEIETQPIIIGNLYVRKHTFKSKPPAILEIWMKGEWL